MKTTHSENYFKRANKVMTGGVNSPVRSFKGVGGQPLVMRYGRGAKLYDADNNVYTDYCLSWGALLWGHAHRNVVLGAKKTIENGTSFGTTTREEIDLAEFITEHVPSIDRIRFVNSGTEATMSAVRLARGFTGRDVIVKFDGCYHGHFDDFLTKAGSGVAQLQESSSQGIAQSHVRNTLSLPYNNVETLEKTLADRHGEIACVIIEPVAGNMGVVPADPGFLKTLRALTEKHKIVLIFDEVMTGFRTHPGCVQSQFGVIPDMTCLGKIIGGGFPVGAYGGREEIMDGLAPKGGVYQAGTFSGNPAVMKAGLATLKLSNNEFYKNLNERCDAFARHLNKSFQDDGIDAHLSQFGSMMSIRFRKEPVRDYDDAMAAAGGERYGKLFWKLIENGIYWPPADLEAFFVSGMHSGKDLEHLGKQLKTIMERI